ncbi:sulfite exporter TauE/SafE family protein [Aliiroseovarius crassostreae]|uniref:sulfite exporter TauE/SafE family protein n=1 Tax=Aliiroseovarius crassostreae TaxID=154981 RepID=UPI00220A036C|nr:sulfite exporter TauE/SafE family protein [Aliiroseovarius crassostreae]UWQ02294.1 sulfite exporter TauE/SafE family protein [Aliiroseovarius crassostreae]
MPEILDFTFFAFAIPAVLFAGISKGGFGSGAAFAATPLLALILEPGAAIGLMLPLLMLMDVTALRPYWGKWDGDAAKTLILGALPGVALGAVLYSIANADLFRLLIGLIAVGFVAFQIARGRGWIPPAAHPMGKGPGLFWGILAGLTSFISHAGGPPAAVFLLSRRLDKLRFQATTVIVFWAINGMKFIPYAALDIFSWQTIKADLFLAPFAVAGIWAGVKLHHLMPEHWFFRLTYAFLLITGTKLIWEGLT